MTQKNFKKTAGNPAKVTPEQLKGKCIDPRVDWAFKRLFGEERNKRFLISLLNEVLRRPTDNRIVEITYEPQEKVSFDQDGKSCRFDILCTTSTGEICHIEMQNSKETHFNDRLLYYSSIDIERQGIRGGSYALDPLYTVAICSGEIHRDAKKNDRYVYYYQLREECNIDDVMTDSLNIILVELGQFDKSYEECDDLLKKWIYLFNNISTYTIEEVSGMFGEEILREFVDEATFESMTPDEKIAYVRVINDARVEQHRIEEEIAHGREKGRKEGREERTVELAKSMKETGIPIDTISKITGMSVDYLMSL